MVKRLLLATLALMLLAPPTRAEVKLHPLFSDGMVLQQGKQCSVWGTGEQLTVSLTRMPQTMSIGVTSIFKVGPEGTWTTSLEIDRKMPSGEPYCPPGGP